MLSSLVAIVCALTSVHRGHAAAPPALSPYAASLCSALFLERPDTPPVQGSLRYHLNTMNAEIFHHLEQLDGKVLTVKDRAKKFLWSMKPSRVVEGMIESRRGKKDLAAATDRPVRAVFRDLASNEWRAATEPTIAAVVGRLRQLDADFSNESGINLTFGHELRGRDQINAYLERVEAHARALDVAVNPRIDAEHPYFTSPRVIGRVASVGVVSLYLEYIIWPIVKDAPGSGVSSQVLTAALLAYVAPPLYSSLRKSTRYAFGGVSEDTRVRYENEYASHRTHEAIQFLDEMKKMTGEKPSADSFVYNTVDALIPRSFATALSDAQSAGADADPEELAATILRRRRGIAEMMKPEVMAADAKDPSVRLMTDQFLFFDRDTGEPVLVSFLRVKKPTVGQTRRRKKTSEAPRPIFAPEGALGTAG